MVEPKKNFKDLSRTAGAFMNRAGKIERLDRNERTTPFSEEHLKKIWASITPEEVVAYPELESFYTKLSEWLGIDRSETLLVAGSDTGIRAVYEVYVEEGDEVLMFPPTYGMYPVYSRMFGAVKREINYNEDFTLPMDKVLEAINPKTKLVAIANPNHTGTPLAEVDILHILKAAKENQALVIIDEAYYHFYDGTMLPYIEEFDNLIIVRTFSKAFGIAAMRIGYVVGNKDVIAQLFKAKLTHEITAVSAKFGEYLLDHMEILEDYVRDVRDGIEYLTKEFFQLGIKVPRTHTNFIFAKLPDSIDAVQIIKDLKEKAFYISGPFSISPVNGCIRITVGPVEQMRKFLTAFKSVYETCNATVIAGKPNLGTTGSSQ